MSTATDRDVFDRIRAAAADVARGSRYVHLVEEQIAPYAATLAATGLPAPVYDADHHAIGSPVDLAAFHLTLDSINFGSGYFPHLRKRPGLSGYYTVSSSLKDRWEQDGPFSAAELRAITPADCAVLFGQKGNKGPAQELMTLFAQALNDLGAWLGARYNDDPLLAIAAANGSAARLVELVSAMPLYRDIATYHGREIPLYKRAQILATDLAIAFADQGPGAFHDLDRLTIFADNLVPHVLRVDDVLAYDAGLLARIERGDLIPAGSAEEVEIRAVTIHAVERLVDALRASGIPATARLLDYHLWNRGAGELYKALPRHRTRTVFY
jgi:hypothetical protein